jgi:hypothetical protein
VQAACDAFYDQLEEQVPSDCPNVDRVIEQNGCMTAYMNMFVGCEDEYIAWHECLAEADNLISTTGGCSANVRNENCADEITAADACR